MPYSAAPVPPARTQPPTMAIAAVVGVLLLVYLLHAPPTLDLAAQVARATLFHDHGVHIWWPGWFAGTNLAGYSVLAPLLMAVTGVPLAGALATLAASASGAPLFGTARRPRLAIAAFVAVLLADLLAGRVTFVIGSAFALLALRAVQRRSRWAVIVPSIAATLSSPLAGLFLGLLVLAVAMTDASRRRVAVLAAATAAVTVAITAALFPSTAVMPFGRSNLWMSLIACLVLLATVPIRLVRGAACLFAMSVVAIYNVPSAIGSNISRLAMLFALPVLVGWATVPRRTMIVGLVPLIVWPTLDLTGQLTRADDTSSSQSYYLPLLTKLDQLQKQAQASGQPGRVEIVDPRTHWASVYIAAKVPLARGWERQLDVAGNRLFYSGTLTAESYHAWLRQLAVRWVALPDAPLDYAAVAEGRLVDGKLAYLAPVWSGPHWRLYAVQDPQPVVRGAVSSIALYPTGIEFQARSAGVVRVAVRYTTYLRVREVGGGRERIGCVEPDGQWSAVDVPSGGTYRIDAPFSLTGAMRWDGESC
jgi:hypothetical protein